ENRSGPSTDRGRRDPRIRRDHEYLSLQPAHRRLGAHHHRHRRDRHPAPRLWLGRAPRVHAADPLAARGQGRGGHLPDLREPEPGQYEGPGGAAPPPGPGRPGGGRPPPTPPPSPPPPTPRGPPPPDRGCSRRLRSKSR